MPSTNHCPKCRTPSLRELQSAAFPRRGSRGASIAGLVGLPQRCSRCHGFWVKVSSIAALQESGALSSIDEDVIRAETDQRTGLCPGGHGILARAKASWTRPFYVERCLACSGIWLDAGEWKRLSGEHLLEHLEDLWLPTWRKQMQRAHSAEQLQSMLNERLGRDLMSRLEALAAELAVHDDADLGFSVFRERFESGRPRRAGKG